MWRAVQIRRPCKNQCTNASFNLSHVELLELISLFVIYPPKSHISLMSFHSAWLSESESTLSLSLLHYAIYGIL